MSDTRNTIIHDQNNPNITVIRTPQGDMAFNFGIAQSGIDIESPQVPRLYPFSAQERQRVEALLDQTLNPAKDTSEKLQQLQSKFNEILVSSLNHYGKPLDVGTSPLLISEVGGGALSNQKGQENTVALGLNLDEITKAKFLGSDGKKHEMTQSEILRHELFHFVDVNVQDLTLKETRAVWFVNQFQAAEGRALRASYFNPDSAYYPGIVPVTGFSDGRILGVKIPGQRGFPEPSPDFNRWNETQRLNHNNAVEINGQVEPSEMMNLYVRAKETIASNIGDMQPAQQAIILARTHEVVMGNIEQHTSKIADYEKA